MKVAWLFILLVVAALSFVGNAGANPREVAPGARTAAPDAAKLRAPRGVRSFQDFLKRCDAESIPYKLSLRELAEECEKEQRLSGRMPRRARRLYDLNVLFGLEIDAKNNDVLLLGLHDPDQALLDIDDIATAIRAVWGGQTPMCSLDPDTDPSVQKCVVRGVPRNSRFADVMLAADYRMKEIAIGLHDPNLPDLRSWPDLLRSNPNLLRPGARQRNRWWFTTDPEPRPRTILFDDRVCLLTHNPVVVLSEEEVDGVFGTGKVAPEGAEFATSFTRRLLALAKKEESIAALLQVYRLIDLFVHIKAILPRDMSLPGRDYWEEEYRSRWPTVPRTMPSLTRKIRIEESGRFVELNIRGGVRIALDPPKKIVRATFEEPNDSRIPRLVTDAKAHSDETSP
jgi:hypothetical protein